MATPQENQRLETRHVGAAKRAFRACHCDALGSHASCLLFLSFRFLTGATIQQPQAQGALPEEKREALHTACQWSSRCLPSVSMSADDVASTAVASGGSGDVGYRDRDPPPSFDGKEEFFKQFMRELELWRQNKVPTCLDTSQDQQRQ